MQFRAGVKDNQKTVEELLGIVLQNFTLDGHRDVESADPTSQRNKRKPSGEVQNLRTRPNSDK
jgi:hypothetical protein